MKRLTMLCVLVVFVVLAACDPIADSGGSATCPSSGCVITGRILTEGGEPLEEVNVTLMSGSYRLFAQTDKNGYYELAGVTMNRDYCIWPKKGPWEFDPEEQCIKDLYRSYSNQDFVAAHIESFDISGQVVNMSGPMHNVALLLTGHDSRSARTSLHGFYAFRGLRGREDYCITPIQEGFNFEPVERCYTYLDSTFDNEDYLGTETE